MTRTALDCELATIQGCIAGTSGFTGAPGAALANGDTLNVPPGQAIWDNELAVNAVTGPGISIIGATRIDLNFIRGQADNLPYPGGNYSASNAQYGIASNQPSNPAIGTVITRSNLNSGRAIHVTGANNKVIRVSGFTFETGSGNGNSQGFILVDGQCDAGPTSSGVRIDNLHLKNPLGKWFATADCVFGVMDHCLVEIAGNITQYWHNSYRESTWTSGTRIMGEGSFADPANWGSYKFWFLEDNIIRGFNNATGLSVTTINGHDAKEGARVVQRYNRHYNWYGAYCHGTEGASGSTAERGGRAWEQYNNINHKTTTGGPAGGQMRSGNILHHDNAFYGTIPGNPLGLTHYRSNDAWNGFGGANGSNPWDLNDRRVGTVTEGGFIYNPVAGPNSYGGLYASGVHFGPDSGNGAQGNQATLKVSPSPGWQNNQWVGFTITNLDQPGTTNGMSYSCSRISSSGPDTITCFGTPSSTEAPSVKWVATNRFEVRRPARSSDQSGWGRMNYFTYSTTIVGGVPAGNRLLDTPIYTTSNRDFEASYSWANTYNGIPNEAVCGISSGYPSIKGGGTANYPPAASILPADPSTYPPSYYTRAPNSSDPANTYPYTPYVHPHPLVQAPVSGGGTITLTGPSTIAGGNTANYTINDSNTAASTVTINFDFNARTGDNLPSIDYTSPGTSTTITAGQSSKTIAIPITARPGQVDKQATFFITSVSGDSSTLDISQRLIVTTITNTVSVTVSLPSDTTVKEGSTIDFTITASGNVPSNTTVNYTMAGTAVKGTNYSLSGPVNQAVIASGTSSKVVTLTAIAVAGVQPDLTAIMNLATGTGYSLGTGTTATAIIKDAAVVVTPPAPASINVRG